jgi:hypothetical protein
MHLREPKSTVEKEALGMAKFTLVDDKTEVATATMRLDKAHDSKRLHLHDVGSDKKLLQIDSTNGKIATATLVALYNGPKGIWTIDILAKDKGNAEIQAKLKGAVVAKVGVTVIDKLELPAASSEEGMLIRLLLAENRTPSEHGYNAAKVKTSMQWMRIVLVNRLKNKPEQFGAPNAKTIEDIVKAKGQFEGFEQYPKLTASKSARINQIVKIANDDNDARQEAYAGLLQVAIEVAKSKTLIPDPCPTGLYGWRTAGSGSPGGRFVKHGDTLSGNEFYTLKE